MRRWLVPALLALAPLLAFAPASARTTASTTVGPDGLLLVPPLERIVDQPGVLAAADKAALEARLARFESEHGTQVAIVIVATTGVEPIEDFANRVGSAWKIGRRGIGDGLLLVVSTQQRRARIEVARALEGAIPDAVAARAVRQDFAPHFVKGDYAGGLSAALDDLLPRIVQERLGGPAKPREQAAPHNLHLLLPMLVFGVLIGVGLSRAAGAIGAVIAGLGAGALAATALASIALGALIGIVVLVFALVLGAFARYGGAVGGPFLPGSFGGGFGGGGGGGGFSSGGGGDFSGGGASGSW